MPTRHAALRHGDASFFEGFTLERVDVGEAVLRVRHGGSGPPLPLLHGHPRPHTTWHRVAPLLAPDYTVACPDLRGYGESSKPETTPDHVPYSKRAMARDMVALMRSLGHERFFVAGHDRGAYVASHRSRPPRRRSGARGARRHPDRRGARPLRRPLRRRLVALVLSRPDRKPAERVICADPEAWYKPNREQMGDENLADYLRAGRMMECPVLFMWSVHDDMEELDGNPLPIWEPWVAGGTIDSGHHMAEEAPEELADKLRAWLRALA